jgi:hypothetical protein
MAAPPVKVTSGGLIAAAADGTTVRRYDRGFDWSYSEQDIPEVGAGPVGLIPVIWGGLWLNTGDQDNGLCIVVENVDGWLDSPPLNGNDVARVISDGAAWGPKVHQARTITISGAAAGPRNLLGQYRDQLAARAASRVPAELVIGDFDLERVLVADVRAGTDAYRQTPLGRDGFRWQVTLTAADPVLYGGRWQTATLSNLSEDEVTGREYPREYMWRYGQPIIPNAATLRNEGNTDAPVFALYAGDLTQSTLTTVGGGIIRVASLDTGMQILVHTATLTAEAAGQSRASYILPGSRPMTIPPGGQARWSLQSAGRGTVSLAWRSAWV